MTYKDLMQLVGHLAGLAAGRQLTADQLVEAFNLLVMAQATIGDAINTWTPVEVKQQP